MGFEGKCCIRCGKTTYVKDALFCPYCSDPLVDKKEFCLRTLRAVLKGLYCPENMKSDIIYDIQNCIDYIKEITEEEGRMN